MQYTHVSNTYCHSPSPSPLSIHLNPHHNQQLSKPTSIGQYLSQSHEICHDLVCLRSCLFSQLLKQNLAAQICPNGERMSVQMQTGTRVTSSLLVRVPRSESRGSRIDDPEDIARPSCRLSFIVYCFFLESKSESATVKDESPSPELFCTCEFFHTYALNVTRLCGRCANYKRSDASDDAAAWSSGN